MPVANAADYIFGYTVQIDVSDRGGRGDRKMGGSDWLIGKNHDTFGPLGPFIVPKEFVKDPMNTRHTFTLNDQVMQDSNTNRMDHNIYELLSYASNILTLNPGDVISGGSPAGTNIERAEPRWMRAGDTAEVRDRGDRHADSPGRAGSRRGVDELILDAEPAAGGRPASRRDGGLEGLAGHGALANDEPGFGAERGRWRLGPSAAEAARIRQHLMGAAGLIGSPALLGVRVSPATERRRPQLTRPFGESHMTACCHFQSQAGVF